MIEIKVIDRKTKEELHTEYRETMQSAFIYCMMTEDNDIECIMKK